MRPKTDGIVFETFREVSDVRSYVDTFMFEHKDEIRRHEEAMVLNRQLENAGMQIEPVHELDESIIIADAIRKRLKSCETLPVNFDEAGLLAGLFEEGVKKRRADREMHAEPYIVHSTLSHTPSSYYPDMSGYDDETRRLAEIAKRIKVHISQSAKVK